MKLKQFQSILKKHKLKFALFQRFDPFLFYFTRQSEGLLIVPATKKPFVVSNKLEFERVKKYAKGFSVKKWTKNEEELIKWINDIVGNESKKGNYSYAVNDKVIPLANANWYKKQLKGKQKALPKEVYDLRATKTKEEIKIIKRNVNMTCSIFNKLFNELKLDKHRKEKNKKFVYEIDIRDFLDNEARANGYSLSYPTIVASGKNSSMPHYHPEGKVKLKGFTVIDFGVFKDGYCSDITRTVYFGKPSKKEIDDYYKLLNCQQKYIKMLKLKLPFKNLKEIARKDLGKHFIHSLGHGFGIETHEEPFFRGENKIEKFQTFTIEPGIYYERKYGIRIEDDIFVNNKIEVLSGKLRKDLMRF